MVDMEKVTIGEKIRKLRDSLKLSQEELGKSVGVTKAAISAIESGRSKDPKLATFFKIAKRLGVDPEWLAIGKSAPDLSKVKQEELDHPHMTISDDSMAPVYIRGSKIYYDPSKRPKPGDVIVLEINGTMHIRKMRQLETGGIECVPLNDFYPKQQCEVSDIEGVATKHVIDLLDG